MDMRDIIKLIESAQEDDYDENNLDNNEEDDYDLPWDQRWKNTITLPAGTILYHGTSEKFPAEQIEGPAWFTTNRKVADYFKTWRGQNSKPRVLTYRLSQDLKLPKIDNRRQFEDFKEKFWISDTSSEDMIDSMQNIGLPGWYISNNYNPGDDILIMRVNQYVEKK